MTEERIIGSVLIPIFSDLALNLPRDFPPLKKRVLPVKRNWIHTGRMIEFDMIHLGVYWVHLKRFYGAGLKDGVITIELG